MRFEAAEVAIMGIIGALVFILVMAVSSTNHGKEIRILEQSITVLESRVTYRNTEIQSLDTKVADLTLALSKSDATAKAAVAQEIAILKSKVQAAETKMKTAADFGRQFVRLLDDTAEKIKPATYQYDVNGNLMLVKTPVQ